MPGKEELITIHRYLTGEMDQSEKLQFEQRLVDEPELAALKTELETIWSAALHHPAPAFDSDAAFRKFQGQTSHPARSVRLYRLAAAAAVLLVVALSVYLLRGASKPMHVVHAAAVMEKKMNDGSMISLREGSDVRLPESFDGAVRKVELVQGEALFEVAKDRSRPFIISHAWAEVRVTGTEFVIDVDTAEQTYTLKVMEGEVQFTPELSSKSIPVKAGSGVRFHADSRVVERLKNIDENAASWKTGVLSFEDSPLNKVIEDLKAHYHIGVTLANPSLATCRFTAPLPYKDVPVKNILEVVATTFGMSLDQPKPNSYVLRGGNCK